MFASLKVILALPVLLAMLLVYIALTTTGWAFTRLSEVVLKVGYWVEYHAYKDLMRKRGFGYLGHGLWTTKE